MKYLLVQENGGTREVVEPCPSNPVCKKMRQLSQYHIFGNSPEYLCYLMLLLPVSQAAHSRSSAMPPRFQAQAQFLIISFLLKSMTRTHRMDPNDKRLGELDIVHYGFLVLYLKKKASPASS